MTIMKKKLLMTVLIFLTSINMGMSADLPSYSVSGDSLLKDASLYVNCDIDLGPLSQIWSSSVSVSGLGAEKDFTGLASNAVMNDFSEEIGFWKGLGAIEIDIWKLEDSRGTIDKYDSYFESIQNYGGKPLVHLVGTPKYLQDPSIYEENPNTYMGYPTNDLEGWRDLIYNILKYIVVPDEFVSDPNLFAGVLTPVPTLGLGDNIFFGFWKGIGGIDKFQWKGTEEELMAQWDYTVQAVYQLEADYPGIDIKIGGMEWNTGFEFDHFEPGQTLENWLIYSRDNGLTVDFVDFCFNSNLPFGLSMPLFPNRDFAGITRDYLNNYGFDPETPIINSSWHSIIEVTGENSARGFPLSGIELQSHIMAALIPARLYDMELAGVNYHHREGIQDFNAGLYPLFMDNREPHLHFGGTGLYTIGLEEEKWFGLRKPEFHAWKMINMLRDRRVETRSSILSANDNRTSLNLIGTKDPDTGAVAILIWYYLDPNILGEDPIYSELLSTFPPINADIEINGLEYDTDYIIREYHLSETNGNSFTRRFEIYDLIQSNSSLEEINQGDLYDLIPIEEKYLTTTGSFYDSFLLEPYSLLLISLEKDDITNVGDESSPSSPELPNAPFIAYQNVPNPFNPSTQISFTIMEAEGSNDFALEENGKRPISIGIYNLRGRLVKELLNDELLPGDHTITWNGRDHQDQPITSGIYFYCLSSKGYKILKKMTMAK